MKSFFLAIVLFFLWINNTIANEHNFRFRSITVADGLSSNRVRAIVQDKHNLIWFGSDEGLDCYYGTHIKSFKFFADNTPNLAVMALLPTDTTLWIGTEDGLFTFNYATEQICPFVISTSAGVSINTTVAHIAAEADGAVWIATMGQGLFRFDAHTHTLQQYSKTGQNDYKVNVTIDAHGDVWTLSNWSTNDGIYKFNRISNRFEKFNIMLSNNEPYDAMGLALLPDDDDNKLWIGTFRDGLLCFDTQTGIVTQQCAPSEQNKLTHIHSLLQYAPHQILIGSDDGLAIYNTQTQNFTLFTHDDAQPYSISGRFIYPLVRDNEGGVWIGTFYNGVNYISPRSGTFECFTHSNYVNSLRGSVVSRFCEDDKNNIWIATDDGGLSCFNPKTRQFRHFETNTENLHALCFDGDELWVGSYTGGIDVINVATRRLRNYSTIADADEKFYESSCYSLFKDNNGTIWVGTMSNLFVFDRTNNGFRHVRNMNSLIIDINQDADGNMWFSTQSRGLFKYTPQTGSWTNYRTDDYNSSLPHNQVNSLCVDPYGTVWVGTVAGLCRYNKANNTFDRINLNLPNSNICGIVADGNTLILSTSNGLAVYYPYDSRNVSIFTVHDGLLSNQHTANAIFKAHNGRIYAGSVNGFCAFFPSQIEYNQNKPKVVFTELKIFNTPVKVGSEQLPQSLLSTPNINLSYKENNFSIQFSSLSYCTPENNQYAYYLEGFDKNWNYVGNQNEATYTNLQPGTYTLHVRATNNDSVWCANEATLIVNITPPFYWNLPAKIIYFLLAIALMILIVRIALKRSEQQHQQHLMEVTTQRERMLHEAKIRFFTIITHEIRTPLSLIIGPLEQILKQSSQLPENIKNSLQITYRNTQRLLTLVNQLLDFRKIEECTIYHMRPTNIRELLQSVVVRFEPIMEQDEHTLNVTLPPANTSVVVDAEAITKLVSNLLFNANKYANKQIELQCTILSGQMRIVISDDGQGISPADQQNIFRDFYQGAENKPGTGIGLSIAKSMVEAHQGKVEVRSKEGNGTSFVVSIPTNLRPTDTSYKPIPEPSMPMHEDEPTMPQTAPTTDISTASKKRILLVDDNSDMLQFIANGLKSNYITITATDGKEALSIVEREEIDIIVSDWMMSNMDGRQLCLAIRANVSTSHLPFILLTAKTDVDSKIEGMHCGADCYIEKPFSVDYLKACISNLIELRKMLFKKYSTQLMAPINIIANNETDSIFLTKMNNIIEDNMSNPDFSVVMLAQEMCISRSGLFSKIKSLTDTTPNDLIQTARLKRSAELLKEGKYNIGEISTMVGFNSSSYFAKCFAKHFGVTPTEYVK